MVKTTLALPKNAKPTPRSLPGPENVNVHTAKSEVYTKICKLAVTVAVRNAVATLNSGYY